MARVVLAVALAIMLPALYLVATGQVAAMPIVVLSGVAVGASARWLTL